MKRLILIVLLFIFLNISLLNANDFLIEVTTTSDILINAEIAAKNEFRKKLLQFLLTLNKDFLGENYFKYWVDSKQSFDVSLINQLLDLSDESIIFKNNSYNYSIVLKSSKYNDFIQKRSHILDDSLEITLEDFENKSLRELLNIVDLYLSNPFLKNKNIFSIIDSRIKDIKISHPHKFLIYNNDNTLINLNIENLLNAVLIFQYNDRQIKKSYDSNGKIQLSVGFSEEENKDFVITKSNNFKSLIEYRVDIKSTFNTDNFYHSSFINLVLEKFFESKSGFFEIFYIEEAIFKFKSKDFFVGKNELILSIKEKGWRITKENDYNHIIILQKDILEEKRLNIGAYFIKARLIISIYNSDNYLIKQIKSDNVEAIDNISLLECHLKINNQLIEKIRLLIRDL